MDLCVNLQKLPIDIIREHIIPYTYKKQEKILTNDIKSFYETREYLLKLYHEYWKDIDNHYDWLTNDILRFMNDDVASMYGYTENHYSYYRRMPVFQDKSDSFIYTYGHEMDNIKGSIGGINIRLGFLIPRERKDLIDFLEQLLIK